MATFEEIKLNVFIPKIKESSYNRRGKKESILFLSCLEAFLVSTMNLMFHKFLIPFSGTIVAGLFFGCLALGGCNVVYILIILTVAVMFNGASSSGIGPNVIDLSPNFCGKHHVATCPFFLSL